LYLIHRSVDTKLFIHRQHRGQVPLAIGEEHFKALASY
jgi:hypothetical protein